MLNKLGKKICAGVGAFITVFGSSAIRSSAHKTGQSVSETKEGGFSKNGSLFSPRTLLEILTFGGLTYYGHTKIKAIRQCMSKLSGQFEEELNKDKNIQKLKQVELEKEKAKQILGFLEAIIHTDSKIDDISRLECWRDLEKERYDFVPLTLDGKVCQVLGVFDLAKSTSLGQIGKVGKQTWDFNLSEEEIKKIINSKEVLGCSLALLDEVRVVSHRLYGGEENIFNDSYYFGLDEFNGGSDVKLGENCKRVFSKYQCHNRKHILCEGFIMKGGSYNRKGLVLRFTCGSLVEKAEKK